FAFFSALTLGWFSFLQRTLPKLTWNWDIIGMALLSVVIILFLAQKFLNGLSKSIATKRGTNWTWPWKWTWSLLVAILLLFLVGMAVGGTVHQIGWIISSPESLLQKPHDPYDARVKMEILESLGISAGENDGKIAEIREEFWKARDENYRSQNVVFLLQKYHVLVVVDDQEKFQGTIIFPRDATLRKKLGGYCSLSNEDRFDHRWENISALLEKYRSHLVSF
ncbi:MAG: hypothetical protein ABIR24_13885, partial [Verrucomicrobiota bacterium]